MENKQIKKIIEKITNPFIAFGNIVGISLINFSYYLDSKENQKKDKLRDEELTKIANKKMKNPDYRKGVAALANYSKILSQYNSNESNREDLVEAIKSLNSTSVNEEFQKSIQLVKSQASLVFLEDPEIKKNLNLTDSKIIYKAIHYDNVVLVEHMVKEPEQISVLKDISKAKVLLINCIELDNLKIAKILIDYNINCDSFINKEIVGEKSFNFENEIKGRSVHSFIIAHHMKSKLESSLSEKSLVKEKKVKL